MTLAISGAGEIGDTRELEHAHTLIRTSIRGTAFILPTRPFTVARLPPALFCGADLRCATQRELIQLSRTPHHRECNAAKCRICDDPRGGDRRPTVHCLGYHPGLCGRTVPGWRSYQRSGN